MNALVTGNPSTMQRNPELNRRSLPISKITQNLFSRCDLNLLSQIFLTLFFSVI